MVQDSGIKKLALMNGNVITMDDNNPRAQAIFVIEDKIFKVGSNTEIQNLIDEETEEINLQGKTLVPGFVDCHAHPMYFGQSLMAVNCRTPPIQSIKEMMEQIQEAATKKAEGDWIIGRGYDDFKLTEKKHPSRWDIDEAAPKHPVVITRMCGHVITVNSRALELAGISIDSKDPEGGRIDRDQDSKEPNGVIRGNAQELIWKVVPPPDIEQLKKGINLAAKELLARGVTSISEAGVDKATMVQAYQAAIRENDLPLRVNLMMSANVLEELTKLGIITGFGDERLRIGAIKILADGSTSGRTAALSEPYMDVPETTGIMYISPTELNSQVLIAHKAGFQVGVHAIGDRAISVVLDAIEAALENTPRADHRH